MSSKRENPFGRSINPSKIFVLWCGVKFMKSKFLMAACCRLKTVGLYLCSDITHSPKHLASTNCHKGSRGNSYCLCALFLALESHFAVLIRRNARIILSIMVLKVLVLKACPRRRFGYARTGPFYSLVSVLRAWYALNAVETHFDNSFSRFTHVIMAWFVVIIDVIEWLPSFVFRYFRRKHLLGGARKA